MVLKKLNGQFLPGKLTKLLKKQKMLSVTFITMSLIQSLRPSVTDSGQVISFQMQSLRKLR